MERIVDPQLALDLVNRPEIRALLTAQSICPSTTADNPQELSSNVESSHSDDSAAIVETGEELTWIPLPDFDENLDVIGPIARAIRGTADEDFPPDPDDESEESDPEIAAILAESSEKEDSAKPDDSGSEGELQPSPEDVWYDSLAELEVALRQFAVEHGYSITIARSKPEKEKICFQCDRGAKSKPPINKHPKRKYDMKRSQSCQFQCNSTRRSGRFRLVVNNPTHNHGRIPIEAMPKARKALITEEMREYIRQQSAAGSQPQEIIHRLHIQYPRIPIKYKDIYNIQVRAAQRETKWINTVTSSIHRTRG